jgi:uncharacterized protein (DUF433 family)
LTVGATLVALNIQADPIPLREEASGALRVGGTRVLLELVIRAFEDGATPETIVQRYTTLRLPDVYAVIAYYLRHRSEIDEYLRRREQQAVEVSQRIAATQPDLGKIRQRLLAQRAATERNNAAVGE